MDGCWGIYAVAHAMIFLMGDEEKGFLRVGDIVMASYLRYLSWNWLD